MPRPVPTLAYNAYAECQHPEQVQEALTSLATAYTAVVAERALYQE